MSEEQNKTNREKLFQGVGKSIENSEKVMNPIFGRLRLFKQYQPAEANDWQSQVKEVTQSQKPIQARIILYVITLTFLDCCCGQGLPKWMKLPVVKAK